MANRPAESKMKTKGATLVHRIRGGISHGQLQAAKKATAPGNADKEGVWLCDPDHSSPSKTPMTATPNTPAHWVSCRANRCCAVALTRDCCLKAHPNAVGNANHSAAPNIAESAAGRHPQNTLSPPSISQTTDPVSSTGATSPSIAATNSSAFGGLTNNSDRSKDGNNGHKEASIKIPAHHHIAMNIKVAGRRSPSRNSIT